MNKRLSALTPVAAVQCRRAARFFGWQWRGILGLCVLGLAGCSLPIQAPQPQETWRLDAAKIVTKPVLVEGQPRTVSILLRNVSPAQGLESPAMMYSRAPQVLAPYRDNRWLAPPADMIGDALNQTLARQPWVAGVFRTGGTARVQIGLSCTLEKLEHDIQGTEGAAHLAMDCVWLDPKTRAIQAHWRFDRSEALAQNNAEDFAAGAQRLLDQALVDIVQQTRDLVPGLAQGSADD
ncbi:ABC-type transport auxiliary lipoprotein family protein [Halothiobacillus sp. DCM-1]|uniref:ABC-type transport auxiliary lipoprotein family protein n=1 Tax=Halothiobacillus sp. DCM-1 TaxID=3112558 RepID=UPI003250EC15